MLILTREIGQKIIIGDDIVVTICDTNGSQVKIGIDAPDDVNILRTELLDNQSDD